MAIAKRVVLFLILNFCIVLTLSLLTKVLGIQPYLTARGLNYESLAAFCLVWGMGGAFISLALSRIMAKWMMGVQVINTHTTPAHLQDLVQMVYQLSRSAGLTTMPEIGVYNSPELNAFATGPTKSRSLVAVSSGLLQRMRRDEIEGVLGHEIAHIANGDMVTMTLLQGVVNAFVMFLARIVAFSIAQVLSGSRDEEREGGGISSFAYYGIQIALEIFFMIIGSLVIAAFSRYREYRADAGGARLAGRDKMTSALEALKRNYGIQSHVEQQGAVQNLKISNVGSGIFRLFSTHPPLEERIKRLQSGVV